MNVHQCIKCQCGKQFPLTLCFWILHLQNIKNPHAKARTAQTKFPLEKEQQKNNNKQTMTKTRPGKHDGYLSFSSFLSGVWSTVSFSTLPLRHSMARLSPTLATTSSMPSLSSATVHVVPALMPAPTAT